MFIEEATESHFFFFRTSGPVETRDWKIEQRKGERERESNTNRIDGEKKEIYNTERERENEK